MSDEELLKVLADETAPTPAEIHAVRRGLASRLADRRVSVALLRHLPGVSNTEVSEARLRNLEGTGRRNAWGWLPLATLGAAGTLGTGLVAAVVVALVVTWALAPTPPLAGPVVAGTATPVPHVTTRANGAGQLHGTAVAPEIAWTSGALSVEVDPGLGIALSVVTREATVRVVGTVFDVERDALGTRVTVSRGKVEVTCVAGPVPVQSSPSGPVYLLEAGQEATCVPTTAPGLLARANALKAANADPTAILATVDAGLPLASGPFLGELRALRTEMLVRSGHPDLALAEASRYLAAGGPRRVEVLRLAAAAAMQTGGCPAALPFLLDLEELGAADPEQLLACEDQR